jgi:cytochrome c oxidase assembly protein Cox11
MSGSDENTKTEAHQLNARMFGKLLLIAVMMFGFGYALVPIYKQICELTGVNILTPKDISLKKSAILKSTKRVKLLLSLMRTRKRSGVSALRFPASRCIRVKWRKLFMRW